MTGPSRWRRILAAGSPRDRQEALHAARRVFRRATTTAELHRFGNGAAAQLARRGIDTALFWAAIALLESSSLNLASV